MPREEASTFQFILCSIWKPGDSNLWVKISLALQISGWKSAWNLRSIFQVEWLIATLILKESTTFFLFSFPFHFYFVVFHPNMGCAIASYCCGTHVLFQSVANMAARRSGSLLMQRCIFCSRETLKRRLDSDMRHFSRIRNALFVASCRGGIFFASGKKQLIPLAHNRTIFLMLRLTNFRSWLVCVSSTNSED